MTDSIAQTLPDALPPSLTMLAQYTTPAPQHVAPRMEPEDLAQIIEKYLVHAKTVLKKKRKTLRGYETGLKRFIDWYTSQPSPSRLSHEYCLAYDAFLRTEAIATNTHQVYLNALRCFTRQLHGWGILPWDPMHGIRSPRIKPMFKKQPLNLEETTHVLHTLNLDARLTGPVNPNQPQVCSLKDLRDKTILYLMLKTGLREIEVIRANVEDYQTVPEGRILWIQGKGRDDTDAFVVLRPEVYGLFDAYLSQRPIPSKQTLAKASDPEGGEYTDEHMPLFLTLGKRGGHRLSEITIQGLVRDWLKWCQVKRDVITGHSLRHTAATMALEGGAPVTAVRDMLRHSSMKQTNIYVHTLDRMKRGGEQFITQY